MSEFYYIDYPCTYDFTNGENALFSSGGVASKCKVSSGAHISIGPGGAASATSVFGGGYMEFQSGSLPSKDNKVMSGGVLAIGLGTEAGNIDAANGAILQLTMGGTWFVQRPTNYTVTSNGTAIKKTGATSTTSNGIEYAGYTGWDMKTSGCALTIVDYASAAFVKVSSGCSLVLGGGRGYGAGAAGQIDVFNGGSALFEKADYVGLATVHSGGTMTLGAYSENTTVVENGGYLYIPDETILLPDLYPDYDLNVKIKPNTFKDLVLSGAIQSATAHSGTVASHITLKDKAGLEVYSGGKAVNTVLSSGYLTVDSGGVASDVTMQASGFLRVPGGGRITGKLSFGSGTVYVEDGGIVDFDISTLKGGNAVLLTDYNRIVLNSGELRNTITVSGELQTKGTYALATKAYSLNPDSEYRSEQQKIFAICDASGTKLGAVKVGTKALVGDQTYTLNLSGSGDLSLTVAAYVEGDEIWTESGNSADNGWNNSLLDPKTKELHESAGKFQSTQITSATGAVLLDKTLSRKVNGVTYKNYVGTDDGADFARIVLPKAANLSFTVTSADSAKFTVWRLIPGKNFESYTMKAITSVSTKKASKNATEYTATTKPVLLYEGEYYVSVEASTKKGHEAYYNVSVNQDDSVFFTKGNNNDDWDDMEDFGPDGNVLESTPVAAEHKLADDWVGFGDEIDYRSFTIDCAAMMTFWIEATDQAEFGLYSLNDRDKKGKYSLKKIQSAKLSKNPNYKRDKTDTPYYKIFKPVLLEAGTYYFSMKSTNAAKGGNAEYQVYYPASVFFTKGNNSDDWDDMQDKGRGGHVGANIAVTSATYGIVNDWVGFGDAVDYKKITLSSAAKLSFKIDSLDAMKFSLCVLNDRDKKGKYSLKTLVSANLKMGKWDLDCEAKTRSVLLDAGEYYLRMESTNAKKGGNAEYQVYVGDDSVFFDKVDNGTNNWLFDKAKQKNGEEPRNLQVVNATAVNITASTKAVQIDKANSVNVDGKKNFAGYGDEADFAKIRLAQSAKVSFTINSTDAAKFTVWQLVAGTDKKGNPVYSVKSLQSAALKKGKKDTEYTVTTKKLQLAAGDYYVSVESTNAKKGGNAYYNVNVSSFEALAAHDECALAGPEDVNGWDGASAATFADAPADSGLATLSGADLAEMAVPASCDPAVSPIPVEVSGDLFAGLAAADETSAVFASLPQDDALLRETSGLLA